MGGSDRDRLPCIVCDNIDMATPSITPSLGDAIRRRVFGSTRIVFLLVLSAVFVLCLVFTWTTRDAMASFAFLNSRSNARGSNTGKKSIVDTSPWQTAQALEPLAVSAEEKESARDAQRLADHDVDQAFAAALRQATLSAQHKTLTGDALALSQKAAQLQQLIDQDQAQVQSISDQLKSPANSAMKGVPAGVDNSDLDVAKAQLQLDKDELTDAQQDLDRASGDQTSQIQAELAAHEASMKQYDKMVQSGGEVAVVSAKRHSTLAGRIKAWFDQLSRYNLLQEALQQTQASIKNLTAQHNALEAQANAALPAGTGSTVDRVAKLAAIKDRTSERQILSILDDRIATEQQLATVYSKWSAQVLLQHRIVLHLILQSLTLIAFIGVCMVVADALVRRIMATPALDRRRSQTLRSIFELSIQVAGIVLILFVIFGIPQETPTILGLTTAALTIALQDFIIAFLGWFVLIGKNGIHVGDWVEINGVGGEVTEVHLFTTTLLETGTLADKGVPTGRRITFMNGFAIRGQYFNFSTTGQWMWDEISVSLPATDDLHTFVGRIHDAVVEVTERNARLAEQEWKRGTNAQGLSRFSATPVENLVPSGSGIDVHVRYVTRASERFDVRSRLYQKLVDLLRQPIQPDTVGTR
jgi:small-conductance mechanosensitive channel